VLVSVVDPDIVDTLSTIMLDANANADTDADVAPGEPSQKGKPCVCISNGVPNSCTVTVDVTMFKLALGMVIQCDGTMDVLLVCMIPPARAMLAWGVCSASCAVLGENLHCACHAVPVVPINQYE
jgi:hypothetical protein